MSMLQNCAVFVMRELVAGALKHAGGELASNKVVGLLDKQFIDHSQKLTVAFRSANDRAWRALEISLQGESWWGKVKNSLASKEEKSLAEQIQQFIIQIRLEGNSVDPAKVLEQLRAARRENALTSGTVTPQHLAQQAGQFIQFRDPVARMQTERQAACDIAESLRGKYPFLAAFLTIQAKQTESILAIAVRYFFRRAVEEDQQLFQGLAFAQFEKFSTDQEQAFAGLHQSLAQLGDRLEGWLSDIKETVDRTHGAVLDMSDKQDRQGEQLQQLVARVDELLRQKDLQRAEIRPRDSLSIRSDDECRLVKQLLDRYRALPPEQRKQHPELLGDLGKLQVAAGDFSGAVAGFSTVAGLVGDPQKKAEAHHNAYRAALELRDWDSALRSLLEAIQHDPGRFTPFPLKKYAPRRILGAGGFGVAFLCDHVLFGGSVVIKTLGDTDLDRGIEAVFAEARAIHQLDHPSIIGVKDCDFGGSDHRSRPYLVMDYFDGQTLEEAARGGQFSGADLLAIFRKVGDGLQAAHEKGILHRDVKPANILVRQVHGDWAVKIIDFGLAVRQGAQGTAAGSATLIGSSIAGTIDYAAPEQMGRLPGVPVSPRSDIYGFAKTCCYAMFQTPTPLNRHWKTVGSSIMVDLLENCLHDRPEQRPQSMKNVLEELGRVKSLFKKGAGPADLESIPMAELVADPIPVGNLFPPKADPFAEAEAVLARLRQRFDPQEMQRLGESLSRLRKEAPGPRFLDLLRRSLSLVESASKTHIPRFQALPGNVARIEPTPAAIVTWSLRLTLWLNAGKA